MIAIQTSERNGRVVGATLVSPNDTVMLLTTHGNLVRTPVSSIRVASRVTQGVTLIGLQEGDSLVSVTRVAEDDADAEEFEQGAEGAESTEGAEGAAGAEGTAAAADAPEGASGEGEE